MAEYVTKEQVIDWYRPYGQTDEPIPFETLVSDLRDMKAADVAPAVHGTWLLRHIGHGHYWECSICHATPTYVTNNTNYCQNCGAKMDAK